ncbi:MAG: hypothetical protein ABI595_15160 [Actinomycetota bacterium]
MDGVVEGAKTVYSEEDVRDLIGRLAIAAHTQTEAYAWRLEQAIHAAAAEWTRETRAKRGLPEIPRVI